MNSQALTHKLSTYPPFDNMPILHEQQMFSIQNILNQIKVVIPEKYIQKNITTKPTIQKLLSQIIVGVEAMVKEISTQQPTQQSETTSQKSSRDMVRKLMEALQQSESRSKKLQIKLLTKIKKLDEHIKERDIELYQLRNILEQKQIQIESLSKMNQKKYKQIRQLEEDVYDLEQQLNKNQEKMESQIQVSAIIEKKIQELQNKLVDSQNKLRQKKQREIQNFGVQTQQQDDKKSVSSVLTQNKEKNYLSSIEQLTTQLTNSYKKINQLMKSQQKQKPIKRKSKSFYLNSIFK